ncbi:MAG: NDMA-dependent alcohol dehydrogenase [Actinobacteria bacterium]|nr:NDMA-dependent alcohol dehydrogenase [Actinomycetota bacterium]
MKTNAVALMGPGRDWELVELELDAPRTAEALIRFEASGLCHTDEHSHQGDMVPRFPIVGGHEGAGVVEAVGEGVTRVKPGDHVVCSFIPACGKCRFCARGRSNLCDYGALLMVGCLPDETFRFHAGSEDVGGMFGLGTFSQYGVISEHALVKIDEDIPFEAAALVGCGVPTGWGSAVYAANVEPGDTIAIYGVGGVGINAVQGAVFAGAEYVVAIDPLENKREFAKRLGATHSASSADEAQQIITELTRGVGADKAIITAGLVTEDTVSAAYAAISKGGTVVLTGVNNPALKTISISGFDLTVMEKRIQGSLLGSCNPFDDVPRLLSLYKSGHLKLDELITQRYSLDQVGQAYEDLLAGKNIRGVVILEH